MLGTQRRVMPFPDVEVELVNLVLRDSTEVVVNLDRAERDLLLGVGSWKWPRASKTTFQSTPVASM